MAPGARRTFIVISSKNSPAGNAVDAAADRSRAAPPEI
jgi:hypothetical protein